MVESIGVPDSEELIGHLKNFENHSEQRVSKISMALAVYHHVTTVSKLRGKTRRARTMLQSENENVLAVSVPSPVSGREVHSFLVSSGFESFSCT